MSKTGATLRRSESNPYDTQTRWGFCCKSRHVSERPPESTQPHRINLSFTPTVVFLQKRTHRLQEILDQSLRQGLCHGYVVPFFQHSYILKCLDLLHLASEIHVVP